MFLRQEIGDAIERLNELPVNAMVPNAITGETEDDMSELNSKSTFLLVMQTKHQQELLNKYGNTITMMDAVYRTTKYGFPCFFLTVKTSLGMGRVVGTIILQCENEELLTDGLHMLKQWNPSWCPKFSMTDKSTVELAAIGNVHPTCIRLLCDFHRAQAWERWVSKSANDVLPRDRDTVLANLKNLAYALTGNEHFSLHNYTVQGMITNKLLTA